LAQAISARGVAARAAAAMLHCCACPSVCSAATVDGEAELHIVAMPFGGRREVEADCGGDEEETTVSGASAEERTSETPPRADDAADDDCAADVRQTLAPPHVDDAAAANVAHDHARFGVEGVVADHMTEVATECTTDTAGDVAGDIASLPNFAGTWVLEELDGDFEAWLVDMKQPYYIRASARLLRYGVGRVIVRCEQTGEDFFFAKKLADPRVFRDVTARFTVGVGEVRFFDDIGAVTCETSRWDAGHLVFDAIADDTKLPLQLRMFLDSRGNFVEEMVSCTGRSIKYTFAARG